MSALSGIGLVVCFVAASLAGACNGPALQNVPRANPAVVAGAAAATAAAITLADPQAAARDAEHEAYRPIDRVPAGTSKTAPADVLDRLDAAERKAKQPGHGAPSQTPVTEPDATTAPASPSSRRRAPR